MHLLFDDGKKVVADTEHGYQPEGSQDKLSIFCAQLHAKGHSRISGVMQFEPFPEDFDLSWGTKIHLEMHQHLYCLIKDDHQKRDAEVFEIFHLTILKPQK